MSAIGQAIFGQALQQGLNTLSNYLTLIPQGKIGAIPVQATIEEVHSSSVEITEHPVENGANITDHAYVKPIELVMRCGWSNSSSQALINSITSAAATAITNGPSSLFSDDTGPYGDFVSGIYNQLLNLQQQRSPFTVVTTLRQYNNMLIQNIRVERDQKSSQALLATVTMKQVIIVLTSSSTIPPPSSQANPTNTQDISQLGQVSLLPNASVPGGGALPIPSQWVPGQ